MSQPDKSRVWGIDISHWNRDTDLAASKSQGCKFVIIKGVDGSVHTPYFTQNRDRAIAAGLPWGMYVWLYPSKNVPLNLQVDAWIARASIYPPIGIWMDVEWTTYLGQPVYPGTVDAQNALALFHQKTGRDMGVYSAKGYTDAYLKGFNWSPYKAWIANYGVSSPALPVGCSRYVIHQFTSSLDGSIAPSANKEIDGNYYNGTLEQFNTEFGLGDTPPPPPGVSMIYKCITAAINVRSGPSTAYSIVQGCKLGDKIDVSEQTNTVPPWFRISKIIRPTGAEFIPDAGREWWVSGSSLYWVLESAPPPPPPPPPPPDPTSRVVNVTVEEAGWQTVTATVNQPKV